MKINLRDIFKYLYSSQIQFCFPLNQNLKVFLHSNRSRCGSFPLLFYLLLCLSHLFTFPPCYALTGFCKPTGYPWWKCSGWKNYFSSWGFPFSSSYLQSKKFSSNRWDMTSLSLSLPAVPLQKAIFVCYRVFIYLHPSAFVYCGYAINHVF